MRLGCLRGQCPQGWPAQARRALRASGEMTHTEQALGKFECHFRRAHQKPPLRIWPSVKSRWPHSLKTHFLPEMHQHSCFDGWLLHPGEAIAVCVFDSPRSQGTLFHGGQLAAQSTHVCACQQDGGKGGNARSGASSSACVNGTQKAMEKKQTILFEIEDKG